MSHLFPVYRTSCTLHPSHLQHFAYNPLIPNGLTSLVVVFVMSHSWRPLMCGWHQKNITR